MVIHKQSEIVVLKFGGSSVRYFLKRAIEFTRVLGEENRVVVVVSAFARVTSLLLELAEKRKKEYIEELLRIHERWLNGVEIEDELRELRRTLRTPHAFPSREAYVDHVLSFGERISAKIFAHYLGNGAAVDAYELLLTDGNFGNAKVDLERSRAKMKLLSSLWEKGKIPVVTGFLGNYRGYRTTLGRNGSDYTAGVLGYLLNAQSVVLMSDVDGVYTADPRLFRDARIIPLLSYERALLASRLGMKIVHPRAIEAAGKRVNIVLGSTQNWRIGTTIGGVGMKMPIIVHAQHSPGYYRLSVIGRTRLPLKYRPIEKGREYVSYLVKREELKDAVSRIHGVIFGEGS